MRLIKKIPAFFQCIWRFIKKFCNDLSLVLYDDLDHEAMSLPRIAVAVLLCMCIISWIEMLFYGRQFSEFNTLCTSLIAAFGTYAFKKSKWSKGGDDRNDNNGQ